MDYNKQTTDKREGAGEGTLMQGKEETINAGEGTLRKKGEGKELMLIDSRGRFISFSFIES